MIRLGPALLMLALGCMPAFAGAAPIAEPLAAEPPPASEPAPAPPAPTPQNPAANYYVSEEYQVCVDPQYYDRINETQTNNWRFQVRRRDFNLMRQIAGTWQSQAPNGVGGIEYVQSTTTPEGTFTYEKRTCVSMQGLGTSCPVSVGHGYWAAHMSEDGSIFMATNLSFSGYTGQVIRGICGGAFLRMLDAHTSQNVQTGAISRRVR